ncbi:MAG: DUF4102 domain-containing protein [Sphingobacteriia bacterium]|nr:DUF4102 domain-containing protein [Sphingobacteriia bacterium]
MSDQLTTDQTTTGRGERVALTDRHIRTLPAPATGKRIYFDNHRDAPKGFGVRVMASGTKSFVLRYRTQAGAARIQTIGEYPTWTLTAARLEANAIRQRVDSGADPLGARREERAEPTVTDLVDLFDKARLGELASGPEIRRYFDRDHPDWGHWTPHDLRRTCRTRLSEIGIAQEVAEKVIGHTAQGVVGVYDQHKYRHEIRAALQAWERRLLGIIDPPAGNVVELVRGAA